jgi:hypothetical protein
MRHCLSFVLPYWPLNILSTVKAALKQAHGAAAINEHLSDYYVVEDVQATWRGLAIAILPQDWQTFQTMTNAAFAQYLRQSIPILPRRAY